MSAQYEAVLRLATARRATNAKRMKAGQKLTRLRSKNKELTREVQALKIERDELWHRCRSYERRLGIPPTPRGEDE